MSVQNPETQPIIIRKKVVHGGHHGGAWKVAYADFVTAMMALFIVLWLMNTGEQVKRAVAGYFRDPSGKASGQGSGVAGTGEGIGIRRDDMNKLKSKLESAMESAPDLAQLRDQVQMTVTGEGLRIELMESDVGTFFESGSAQPSASGREMLRMLAVELGKLPNQVLIEGHTDARPFSTNRAYSNWELSADRANAARRLMQESGLGANQVVQVRGYADQQLRKPQEPDDASNRRVSIIVRYQPGTASGQGGAVPGERAAAGKTPPTAAP
ncbi:MAG TPA: flagellar motor protein MotB [Bryobacteraceae bacterium]|nr:flagellar motor protein MotB [Bryobacteraceae bacterium]